MNELKSLRNILGSSLLFAVAAGLGCNAGKVPTTEMVSSSKKLPSSAVTLTEVSFDGYKEILAKHRGNVIVVDFWASWCGPCTQAFPHTLELARKYSDRGLAVISMSIDEPGERDEAFKFLNSKNAMITNLICRQDQVDDYEIGEGIPHYKVYDRQGKVRKAFTGSGNDQEIDDIVQQLLSEP